MFSFFASSFKLDITFCLAYFNFSANVCYLMQMCNFCFNLPVLSAEF